MTCRRTHGAHRLLAGENNGARFGRWAVNKHPYCSRARGAEMLHSRNHLLSDVSALVEIDAEQAVHVGFVWKRIVIRKAKSAARNARRDAMGGVGRAVDEICPN